MFFVSILALISIFCLGLRVITDDEPKMIFSFWRDLGNKDWMPEWISKPVFLCAPCFSSFWGSIIFWFIYIDSGKSISASTIFLWFSVCVSSSFVIAILWNLLKMIMSIREFNDSQDIVYKSNYKHLF